MDRRNLHSSGKRTGLAPVLIVSLLIISTIGMHAGAQEEMARPLDALIPRTTVAPTIDGALDEPAWSAAPTYYLTRRGSVSPGQFTRARMLWDDENLYVAFDVVDGDVRATLRERDARLWDDGDCVELFLLCMPTGVRYELQINPLGAVLDAAHGANLKNPTDFSLTHLRHAVRVEGTINDNERTDQSWSVEMAIPWSDLGGRGPSVGHWKLLLVNINRQQPRPDLLTREISCWPALTQEQSFSQTQEYAPVTLVEEVVPNRAIEGFARIVRGVMGRRDHLMVDFRGPALTWEPDPQAENAVAWWSSEIRPASDQSVDLFFIGQSTGPAKGSNTLAELWIDGRLALQFTPHPNRDSQWRGSEAELSYHYRGGEGISSGLYHLRYHGPPCPSHSILLEVRLPRTADVSWLLKGHTDARWLWNKLKSKQ